MLLHTLLKSLLQSMLLLLETFIYMSDNVARLRIKQASDSSDKIVLWGS